jgi:hypothetical protein
LGAVVLIVVVALFYPRGPRYKGHSLSYWAYRWTDSCNLPEHPWFGAGVPPDPYAGSKQSQLFRQDFEEATRELGVRSFPFLLDELRWRPKQWNPWIVRFQIKFKLAKSEYRQRLIHEGHGIVGFQALGTNGLSVLPELFNAAEWEAIKNILPYFGENLFPAMTNLLLRADIQSRAEMLNYLYGLGNRKKELQPVLLKLAQDSDSRVRFSGISYLCSSGIDASISIPILITSLSDSSEQIRLQTLSTLICYGKEAAPAIPAIDKLKNDPSQKVQNVAISATAAIQRAIQAGK